MMRLILIAWLMLAALPAWAQRPAAPPPAPSPSTPSAPAPSAPAPAAPAPAAPAVAADQAAAVLDMLNDPAKRAAFATTLDAIIRAQGATPPARPAATPPPAEAKEAKALEFSPDSLGAQILVSASAFVTMLGSEFRSGVQAIRSLPLLLGWIETMATSPLARTFLIDVTWRVLLAFALAVAVRHGMRRLLRGPVQRLEAAPPPTSAPPPSAQLPLDLTPEESVARAEAGDLEPPSSHSRGSTVLSTIRRLPRLGARLGLELLPVLAALLAGHLFAGSVLGGQSVSRLIILAVVQSYAICTAILRFSRVMLMPTESRFALAHPTETGAARAIAWIRRLAVGGVVGYVFAEVGFLLGMSPIAHAALTKAVGLYVVVVLMVLAIQNRAGVTEWLRAPTIEGQTAATSKARLIKLRNQLASIWHWIACIVLAIGWIIWALERRDSTESFLRLVFLTVVTIGVSRFVQLALHGLLDKGLAAMEAEGRDHGILARRAKVYSPAAHKLLSVVVNIVTILILLQLHGMGGLHWLLTAPLGRRILSALGTIVVTLLLALAVWEMVNAAIQRHLSRLDREAAAGRSARLRTLLPLMRTALIVTIGIITGLMVLSEIGVNIAPLLADAGIVGIAIGFGSQKLVTDLITGVFLLLENAMQVGDVVKVGELVGTVESLSVRTIRLRSEDGSVHVVPFSAVTTVTNMTREFSRAVVSVTVAYGEDYDRVVEALRDIVREMREQPAWSGIIQDDLEILGLDRLEPDSLTIRCRIRCTAFGRWSVGREFNRRLKDKFREAGISFPGGLRPVLG